VKKRIAILFLKRLGWDQPKILPHHNIDQ
jgi:hypothetical protein